MQDGLRTDYGCPDIAELHRFVFAQCRRQTLGNVDAFLNAVAHRALTFGLALNIFGFP